MTPEECPFNDCVDTTDCNNVAERIAEDARKQMIAELFRFWNDEFDEIEMFEKECDYEKPEQYCLCDVRAMSANVITDFIKKHGYEIAWYKDTWRLQNK